MVEVKSSNGSDLTCLQVEVCVRLAEMFTNVIVSTSGRNVQKILIQLAEYRKKMLPSEVEAYISRLYPNAVGAICRTTPYITENIKKKAARVARHAKIPPSVYNFLHTDLSLAWQVSSLLPKVNLHEEALSFPQCSSIIECENILKNGTREDILASYFSQKQKLVEMKSKIRNIHFAQYIMLMILKVY
jgi:hypothetical protein